MCPESSMSEHLGVRQLGAALLLVAAFSWRSPGVIQLGWHLLLVLRNWGLCVQLRVGKQCSGFGSCPKKMQQQQRCAWGAQEFEVVFLPEMLFSSAWHQLSRHYKLKEVMAQRATRKAIAPCEYMGVLRCSLHKWLLHMSQLAKALHVLLSLQCWPCFKQGGEGDGDLRILAGVVMVWKLAVAAWGGRILF